jgi:hypothetical protein
VATLVAAASGNLTAAATWQVALGLNRGETSSTVLSTSFVGSFAVVPAGNVDVDGIGFEVATTPASPSGTLTCEIYDNTGAAQVAGTETVIDVADLPSNVSIANINGGWCFIKFAAPVTLTAGRTYYVRLRTSVASQVTVYRTSTNQWTSFIREVTTQAPAAGDDLIIAGERTGAGAITNLTVTMNSTATTDYGAGSTNLALHGLAICAGGTLTWGTTAATNYIFRMSGHIVIFTGGAYNQGTVATPCPRDSTMNLQMDCAADGDFGMTVRYGGTVVMQGLSRTSGKDIWYCKLNTDEAIASTSLGVDTDTGWLDNDEIAVAPTSRTAADAEAGTLNGAAGASTLTVDGFAGAGGGLAAAHSGTAGTLPTQAEIILLTRNVRMAAVTSTATTYMHVWNGGVVDIDWAEFRYWGTNTVLKRGFNVETTVAAGGSFSLRYSCIRDTESYGAYLNAAALDNVTIEYCALWNTNTAGAASLAAIIFVSISTAPTAILINGNISIKGSGTNNVGISFNCCCGTITNNTITGHALGIYFNGSAITEDLNFVFTGNICHSNSSQGLWIDGALKNQLFTNTTCWRNTGAGIYLSSAPVGLVLDGVIAYGNVTQNIYVVVATVMIKDLVSNSDATFSTTYGITLIHKCDITIVNSVFGGTVAHTNDIALISGTDPRVRLLDCDFNAGTTVLNPLTVLRSGSITSLKHNGVAGAHQAWKPNGRNTGAALEIDTTIFNTASPSMRMYPGHATRRLQGPNWEAAVASGNTLSVSVTIRLSVIGDGTAYAGYTVLPKLWVRENYAAGIMADTLLATHGGGAGWVTLSGTTAAVTDDAILEFYVDCEGTAGWINVDDFTCVSPDSQGLKFWSAEHAGPLALGQPAGGGSGSDGFSLGRLVL